MGLEAAGHFRQYTAKRRTAMFIKTCPALKKKKSPKTKEAVSKCSILFKIKESENFNHRNTSKYFED